MADLRNSKSGRFTYHMGKIYDGGTEISLAEFNQFIVNAARVLQDDESFLKSRPDWMNSPHVPREQESRINNQRIFQDLKDADIVHRRIYPDLYQNQKRGDPVPFREAPVPPFRQTEKISQAIGIEAEPDAGTAFAEAVEEKDEGEA